MGYKVVCSYETLWTGRTEKNRYSLHRAILFETDEGWMEPGYILHWSNGTEGDLVEFYGDGEALPGEGLRGDMIEDNIYTEKPLPPANIKDVERFDDLFTELCERAGNELLYSEILL